MPGARGGGRVGGWTYGVENGGHSGEKFDVKVETLAFLGNRVPQEPIWLCSTCIYTKYST